MGDFHEDTDDVLEDIPLIDTGAQHRQEQRAAEETGQTAEDTLRGGGGYYTPDGTWHPATAATDSGNTGLLQLQGSDGNWYYVDPATRTYRPLDEAMGAAGQQEDPYAEGMGAFETSAAGDFVGDARAMAAQRDALGEMERIASGQLSSGDIRMEADLRQTATADDLQARSTALQGMQEQGLGAEGAYAGAVAGGQARAQQQHDIGLGLAADRATRADQAGVMAGQLSTGMRGQEFGEAWRSGQSVDDFNRWQKTYRRGTEQRNTDRLGRREEMLADVSLGRVAAIDRMATQQQQRDAEKSSALIRAAGNASASSGDDDENDNPYSGGGTFD